MPTKASARSAGILSVRRGGSQNGCVWNDAMAGIPVGLPARLVRFDSVITTPWCGNLLPNDRLHKL